MNERWLEKFEDYLQNSLTAEDKQEFEAQLASDHEMDEAFKLYIAIETDMRYLSASEDEASKLRATLKDFNAKHIQTGKEESKKEIPIFSKKQLIFYTGIAATLVLIVVSYAVFLALDAVPIERQVSDYYTENFQDLGQTMGNGQDSLQLAIAAYNEKNYHLAQSYLEELLEKRPSDSEVLKNLGLTHLAKQEYPQALVYFRKLAERSDLLNNSGLFLQALTLLIRDGDGDREEARDKLQQVVATQSEGSLKASEWLEELE
jgi:tetratricopeptide (TPR) repeat protein